MLHIPTGLAISSDLVGLALDYAFREAAMDTSGHDELHIVHVFKTAQQLREAEGGDTELVELIAALHEIRDFKFSGDVTAGAVAVRNWMRANGAGADLAETVAGNIAGISYKGEGVEPKPLTLEGRIVQDADRLAAIGPVGLARVFAYGGMKRRPIHNPKVPVVRHNTVESYLANQGTSINHFYEKLLLVFGRFNTATAREIGWPLHEHLVDYLKGFYAQIGHEDAIADLDAFLQDRYPDHYTTTAA